MSTGTYCKFCNHYWKSIKEYDRHISCCEYFYNRRRIPPPPDMSRTKPSKDTNDRLEKLEKMVKHLQQQVQQLKNAANTRNKKIILDWLNQPSQIPEITFEDWMRQINAHESDVTNVVNGNLTDGIISCIYSHIQSSATKSIPIRCFTQKPKTIYVYSVKLRKTELEEQSPEPMWQIMQDSHLDLVYDKVKNCILKIYTEQRTKQLILAMQGYEEYDESAMNKHSYVLDRINGVGPHQREKCMSDIKKMLFPLVEENLHNIIMDIEFE